MLLSAAFVLRIQGLEQISLLGDEFVSIPINKEAHFSDLWARFYHVNPDHVPLYYVLQYAWAKVFGLDVLTQRMFPVVTGVLTLIPVYAIARRLHGTLAAIMSTAFLAFSLAQVDYSQTLRPYQLVVLLGALSLWSFVYAVDGGARRWWWWNWVFNALLLLTHIAGALLLLAQGLYLLLSGRIRLTILWGFPAAATLLPWLLTVPIGRLPTMAMLDPPLLLEALSVATGGSLSTCVALHFDEAFTIWLNGAWSGRLLALAMDGIPIFALGYAAFVAFTRPGRGPGQRKWVGFYLAVILAPIAMVWLLANVVAAIPHVQHALLATLGAALLFGLGVTNSTPGWRRVGLAAAIFLPQLAQLYLVQGDTARRPDFRSTAALLSGAVGQTDSEIVVVNFGKPVDFNMPEMLAYYMDIPPAHMLGPEEESPHDGPVIRVVHTAQAVLEFAEGAHGWVPPRKRFWIAIMAESLYGQEEPWLRALYKLGYSVRSSQLPGFLVLECWRTGKVSTKRHVPQLWPFDSAAVFEEVGYVPSSAEDAMRAERALRRSSTAGNLMIDDGAISAHIALQIAEEHPMLAVAVARDGAARHPDVAPYQFALGIALVAAGDFDQAAPFLRKMIALDARASSQFCPAAQALLEKDWVAYRSALKVLDRRRHMFFPVLRRIAAFPELGPIRPEEFD